MLQVPSFGWEAAAATPFSGCSFLSSCSSCTSCIACIAVSIIPIIIIIIINIIIISVIILEPGGLTAAIPVPGDHSVPTSEGFSELTGDVPGSRPSLDRPRGRVTGYAPRIDRTCGRGRGFFSDELAGLLGGASRLAVATRGRVLCGVSLRACSWTSGPRVRLVWGLMVGFLSCYLTYLVNPLFLGSSCPTFPYDLGVRNLGHSASALVGHLTYDLYSLRAQEIGATMTSASSSSAPNRVPSDVFAGATSGVREPTGQNMAELKMARMTILGSNWGNARRTHHGRVDTIQLLNVAGHLQAVLELGTQATLSQVQEWGWNAVQASEGAPALLWRDGTFTLSEECGREFHTPSGKFAGSAISGRFSCVRPGFNSIVLAAAHLNNTIMKQQQNSRDICAALRDWAESRGAHMIYVDGNQSAHKRWEPASMLQQIFGEGDDWLMPADEVATPLWARTARAVCAHGMCTGFLIHRSLLAEATVVKHGHWGEVPTNLKSVFGEDDRGWHLPSFVTLQSHLMGTGHRIRSKAAKKRRRQRADILKRARKHNIHLPQPALAGSDFAVKSEQSESDSDNDPGQAVKKEPLLGPHVRAEEVAPPEMGDAQITRDILKYYAQYTSRSEMEIRSIMSKYEGQLGVLLAALSKKYGALNDHLVLKEALDAEHQQLLAQQQQAKAERASHSTWQSSSWNSSWVGWSEPTSRWSSWWSSSSWWQSSTSQWDDAEWRTSSSDWPAVEWSWDTQHAASPSQSWWSHEKVLLRIGEASNPGPNSSSQSSSSCYFVGARRDDDSQGSQLTNLARHRIRLKRPLSAPPATALDPTLSTQLDSTTSPATALDHTPATPLDTSPSEMRAEPSTSIGASAQPSPQELLGHDLPKEITATFSNQKEGHIRLSTVGSRKKWRWQATPPGNLKRLTGPDRATPHDALVAWMRIHQGKLVDHSVVMINELLSNSTGHLPTSKPAAPLTSLTSSIPPAHADASSSTCRGAPGHATSSSSASPIAPVQATASSSGASLQNAARICLSLAQAEALLQARLPQQRLPPLACTSAYVTLCGKVIDQLSYDPVGHGILLCLLPKLVLTVSPTLVNSRQREKAIASNLRMASAGQWQVLYDKILSLQLAPSTPHQEEAAEEIRSDLTLHQAKRLLRQGRQQQPLKAWKELLSPGLADRTLAHFQEAVNKLRPSETARAVPERPDPAPDPGWRPVLDDYLRAAHKLKHKKALDPGGWSAELLELFFRESPSPVGLISWLHYANGATSSNQLSSVLDLAHLVMLSKPNGGIRPILISSIWKKIHHSCIAHKANPEMTKGMEGTQYAHLPQGSLQLLTAVEQQMAEDSELVLAQLDIRNAFSSISRDQVMDICRSHLSAEAAAQWLPWIEIQLRRPTRICLPGSTFAIEETLTGIPQGDPLSSLLFSFVFTKHMQQLANTNAHMFLYMDDCTVVAKPDALTSWLHDMQNHLQSLGLVLQMDKTTIYAPTGCSTTASLGALRLALGLPDSAPQGVIICGHALSDDDALPYGGSDFLQQWLRQKLDQARSKLALLNSLPKVAGDEPWAVQTAFYILRSIWSSAFVHVFRSLPATVTAEFAEGFQQLLLASFKDLLGDVTLDAMQLRLLPLSVAQGGFGLPCWPTFRLAARTAALTTLTKMPTTLERIRTLVAREGHELLDRLSTLTGTSVSDMVGDMLEIPDGRSLSGLQRRLTAQLRLSLAGELWSKLDNEHPLSQAWPFHRSNDKKAGPAKQPGQSSWMLSPPTWGCKIPNRTFRDGIKMRLGLPLHDLGARCSRLHHDGRTCGHLLDMAEMHCLHCRQGLLTQRHNLVRDHLCAYARSAGFNAQTEQRYLMDNSPPATEEERPLHRADVLICDPQHGDIYVDVCISTAPRPGRIDEHLVGHEVRKVRSYDRRAQVPDTICAGLRPFVLESRGRAALAARHLASYLIGKRTTRLQQTRHMTYSAAQAEATSAFWAPIACILLTSWGKARGTPRGGGSFRSKRHFCSRLAFFLR